MTKQSEKVFSSGDIIVCKSGHRPMVAESDVYKSTYRFYARYVHSNVQRYVYRDNMKLYDEQTPVKENAMTLYTIKLAEGKTTYGTKVGVNSANKFLMEEKGTGEILVVAPDAVEEIVPHTVSVTPLDSDRIESHYMVEPGKLVAGDLVLHGAKGSKIFSIGIVRFVDTKCKTAKEFRGVKLVTVAV
jgi:hypothetical protein